MNPLRYTLLADGSSDRCLIPVIDWVLKQIPSVASRGFISQMADLRVLQEPPTALDERVAEAVRQLPCDLLLIHRDAEAQSPERRREEILNAARQAGTRNPQIPLQIPLVPVRMTETWLLIDEKAIRTAANNPNGRIPLSLPPLQGLAQVTDPKSLLHQALITAHELGARRREQFQRRIGQAVHRVANLIEDFRPLRGLAAFRRFEEDVREGLAGFGQGPRTEA